MHACMYVCMYVCLYVCLCVWNVWTDVKLLPSPPFYFLNKDMSNFVAGGARDAHWTGTNEDASVSSVISMGTLIDVPALFDISVNGNRLSQEPERGIIRMISTSARLSQSDDYSFLVIWIAIWALQSNILNSGHGWFLETSGQGFGIATFDLPHYYSIDYFTVDSFNSISYLICMHGIQFPTDPIKDPFLV